VICDFIVVVRRQLCVWNATPMYSAIAESQEMVMPNPCMN
jgi:hypothetical protein